MEFYSWNPEVLKRMPMREFVQYFKAMKMLKARKSLEDINYLSFANLKKDAKQKILKYLERAKDEYLEKKLANYKDVVQALASRMMNGKR